MNIQSITAILTIIITSSIDTGRNSNFHCYRFKYWKIILFMLSVPLIPDETVTPLFMRFKSLNRLSASPLSCTLALTSCSNSTGYTTTTGLASIVGIYDWSNDYGVDGNTQCTIRGDGEDFLC